MKIKSQKYSKYVAGVASAALVASAVAPVVSAAEFTDVSEKNSHKPAIDALSEAGIITGYTDGTFQPNKTLTRSDVVKLMGKWLVSLDYNVPADYKTNPRFNDLNSNSNDELLQYAALVKDHGVFKGYEDGTLGAGGNITRENMAIVLVRAYDAVNKTELLTYVKGQDFNKDVTDLETAKAEARPYIDVLDYFDITNPASPNFRPKETTTRAQFASFLHKTINTEIPNEEAPKVEGTTTQVNAGEAGQFLTFKVNGETADLTKLQEAGYTVDFQATASGVIKDRATGELDKSKLSAGDKFSYKVVVSKDGESVESALTEVTVRKFSSYVAEITEVTVTQGNVDVTSGKIAIGSDAAVQAKQATALDGSTITKFAVTYKSSNPAVATVNATNGTVTPISPGTVNIIVEADGAAKSIPLTVVAGPRAAAKVTASTNSVKLLESKKQTIDLTVNDQLGDLFHGKITAESSNTEIATIAKVVTVAKGQAQITVNAVAKGTATIQLKAGDSVIGTVNVSVSDDNKVATRKLETVNAAADLTLELMKGSEDQTVDLVWNQYNQDGFLVGPELEIGSGKTYSVISSNEQIIKAGTLNEDGKFTVTAVSPGTADVVIKQGDVVVARETVTVVNSTPTIASVNFEKVEDVKSGVLEIPVLKAEGITLTSTDFKPSIDAAGVIYLDVNNDGAFVSADDIKLGSIATNYSGPAADIENKLTVEGGTIKGKTKTDASGTVVVSVSNEGASAPVATTTIQLQAQK